MLPYSTPLPSPGWGAAQGHPEQRWVSCGSEGEYSYPMGIQGCTDWSDIPKMAMGWEGTVSPRRWLRILCIYPLPKQGPC